MSDEQSIRDALNINEIRADFIALHTRNFDAYMVGRSVTSEQEFYGAQFDSVIRRIQAEALREAADDINARRNGHELIAAADRWGGYYSGVRVGMENEETALRLRADRIERGETA